MAQKRACEFHIQVDNFSLEYIAIWHSTVNLKQRRYNLLKIDTSQDLPTGVNTIVVKAA